MKTPHSARAILAMALGVAAFNVASCGGDNAKKPVQDATYFTLTTGGSTTAYGWTAGKGWNLAPVGPNDTVVMAAPAQTTNQTGGTTGDTTSGGGGGDFFSASVAPGGSFNGSVGGSSSFNGSVGGSATFSGSLATGGEFTGSAILSGGSCSVEDLCEFTELLCQIFSGDNQQGGCGSFTLSECLAEVSQAEFDQALEQAAQGDGVAAELICAFFDYFGCIARAGGQSLENISEAAAESCAESSGLGAAFTAAINSN